MKHEKAHDRAISLIESKLGTLEINKEFLENVIMEIEDKLSNYKADLHQNKIEQQEYKQTLHTLKKGE